MTLLLVLPLFFGVCALAVGVLFLWAERHAEDEPPAEFQERACRFVLRPHTTDVEYVTPRVRRRVRDQRWDVG